MQVPTVKQWLGLIALPMIIATALLSAQKNDKTPPNSQQGTVFRSTTNAVFTSVIVRDKDGRFAPDLKQDDFKVYEDGILQTITTFSPWIGGRSLGNLVTNANVLSVPRIEGLQLPTSHPKSDSSG